MEIFHQVLELILEETTDNGVIFMLTIGMISQYHKIPTIYFHKVKEGVEMIHMILKIL